MKLLDDWLFNTAIRPDGKAPQSYHRQGSLPLPKNNIGFQAAEELDRPLIDIMHEATFSVPEGMHYVKNDIYAFRTALRKAHCFTIDTATSALIADFAIAIAPDIDSVRQLAVPPFPTTWFEVDNRARLNRVVALGGKLTLSASGPDVVPRIGWLITTHGDEYIASYCCVVAEGPCVAPLSYLWRTGAPSVEKFSDKAILLNDHLVFGVHPNNVSPQDASLTRAWPYVSDWSEMKSDEFSLMKEIAGELRSIFGLLLALNAAPFGAANSSVSQTPSTAAPFEVKGKTLFPIEHKILTIKLGRKARVETVVTKAITHHKNRFHEVRGHLRQLKNKDGAVRFIQVKTHSRGDERLGKIIKTYRVEK